MTQVDGGCAYVDVRVDFSPVICSTREKGGGGLYFLVVR